MRCAAGSQELDYEEHGDGKAVVVIHGLTTDRRLLFEACEAVLDRPGVRRIYVDLPGHGASSANLVGATADGLVETLKDFIVKVAGEDAAVVGHSYGGYVALGLARELPTLNGLFLICPIVHADLGWRTLPGQRYAVLEEGLDFRDDQERQTFDAEVSVYTRENLARFRRLVDPAHRSTNRTFVSLVRSRYVMSVPVLGALSTFARPVSIVCGQLDYWAGFEDAVQLVRAFPRCDLRVLSGCGHFLPLEKPAELGRALEEWRGDVSRPLSHR